ncbi:hypothetical protein CPB85DRAFT_1368167 [Mucidula mucida]|nr:hypothetical protein CPB85DRAFT_1368167 [Mucidula mucida]
MRHVSSLISWLPPQPLHSCPALSSYTPAPPIVTASEDTSIEYKSAFKGNSAKWHLYGTVFLGTKKMSRRYRKMWDRWLDSKGCDIAIVFEEQPMPS